MVGPPCIINPVANAKLLVENVIERDGQLPRSDELGGVDLCLEHT